MKLSANNFLTIIKALVVGGGRNTAGSPANDAGFLVDRPVPLSTIFATPASANAIKQTVMIPVQLSDLVNSATWKIAVPFAATISSALFRTGKPASTAAKAATLTVTTNGGTAVTGGVITLTSANQNTTGGTAAATAISGAGATITAGQTIEFAVSSVTAFVEGDGYVEFTVTNNDLTNQFSLVASETNLAVLSAPASTTAVGSLNTAIPRDYDEATDSFALHIGMAMSGSTDTPALTAIAYRKRPGGSIVTVATATGKKLDGTTLTPSTTEQLMVFDFSQHGLLRNDAITIVITAAAHTTDAVLVYFAEHVYRSTLVSYAETDGANSNTGNYLR